MGLWEKAQHRFETAFGSEQARAFARFTRADLIRRIRVGFSGSYIPNKNRPFKYSATAHCGAGSCIRIEIPISFKNASSWLATSRDLELRKCAQRRNVGIAPPAVAHICSNDANTDFFCRHDVFSLLRLIKQAVAACLLNEPDRLRSLSLTASGNDNVRPCSAKATAVARPIPEVPPVINATFPQTMIS